jgi:hypothetical protein
MVVVVVVDSTILVLVTIKPKILIIMVPAIRRNFGVNHG